MKKINYILGAFAAVAMSLAACSPEEFDSVDEKGLPLLENYSDKVSATVDPAINQVTFKLEGDAVYPIWFVNESATPYSTQNGLKKIFSNAGDYEMEYRVGNRNGFSQGIGKVSFHIDNSLVDMTKYTTLLSGKTWRIAKDEQGHLGCGEPGTDGLGWYSATPNEKAGTGLYDDGITFTADGSYTYSPGADGLMLVNTGCTAIPGNPNDGNDFDAVVQQQTATYTIEGRGNDVYLVLPSQTMFPYVSCDNQYDKPEFRIESITGSELVLVYDDGTIAWHYILTSKADEPTFDGFDPNSDFNMFKNCTFTNTFYYAPNWGQIADPTMTVDGNSYTVSLPTATSETWQAQVMFHTNMTTTAASNYDFSCKLMSTTDHNNVTVKLAKEGDDNTFFFTETVKLKAYEEYVFYKSDMAGIDMDGVNIVFDFGGNADNTDITISNIVLKDHANDDGTVVPSEDEDKTVYTYDSENNLWKVNVDDTDGYTTQFYYAPGWTQIADPGFSKDGGTYTITLPTATSEQWQAQVKILTSIPAEADTPYDFSCTLMSDKELKGATVKLTDSSSDDNYMVLERVDLAPYEENVVKVPATIMEKGAAGALTLVLDFGGCQDNTTVTLNNIVLQKTAK